MEWNSETGGGILSPLSLTHPAVILRSDNGSNYHKFLEMTPFCLYRYHEVQYASPRASALIFCVEMATNGHSGYPLKWFKDQNAVRHAWECAICLEVLCDPVQVRDCGHQFCALCIDDILK